MSDSKTIESRLLTAAQALAWWGALLGGALLFLHFYKIRYLPNFDLSSLMGTVAAVAAMGVITFLVLLLLLVLPGMALVAGDLLGVVQTLPTLKSSQRLSDAEVASAAVLLRAWALGSSIGLAALTGCIVTDAPLWVFYVLFGIAPIVWAALVVAAIWKNMRPLAKAPWGMAVFSYFTFTYFGAISFVSLHKLGAAESGQPELDTILGIVLGICAGQFVVYATKGLSLKRRGALVGLVGMALLLGTSMSGLYTQSIGRHFGFGQTSGAYLAVTTRGCEILRAASIGIDCHRDPRAQNAFRAGPVDIWTRIGRDTLLSPPSGLSPADRAGPRMLLPNTEILSVITADLNHAEVRQEPIEHTSAVGPPAFAVKPDTLIKSTR